MKCIPLIWPGDVKPTPQPTFVLNKKEIEALLDVPNKNPRSQWLMASFARQRLYVCDGHRVLGCETPHAPTEPRDEHYIAIARIKGATKGAKLTTAFLVTRWDLEGSFYRVAALETGNKAWDLFPDEPITEHGSIAYDEFIPEVERSIAVPSMELLEKHIESFLTHGERNTPTASKVSFAPRYLATFGKLAQLTEPHITTMFLGERDLDAALFEVLSSDNDTRWRYVLMPMRSG